LISRQCFIKFLRDTASNVRVNLVINTKCSVKMNTIINGHFK